MPIPLRNCWFENLSGEHEWFDFELLQSADVHPGRVPPHLDKVLCAIPSGRWVLMFVDGLGNLEAEPGSLIDFSDIEVTLDFVAWWLDDNNYPRRDEPGVGLRSPRKNPYRDPRVKQFYEDCESRSRSLVSRPGAETESPLAPNHVQETPPIYVDVNNCSIYIHGNYHSLKNDASAVCLEHLVKKMGEWVSVTKLTKTDPRLRGANPKRLGDDLREIPILAGRIEAMGGKGTRFVSEGL